MDLDYEGDVVHQGECVLILARSWAGEGDIDPGSRLGPAQRAQVTPGPGREQDFLQHFT